MEQIRNTPSLEEKIRECFCFDGQFRPGLISQRARILQRLPGVKELKEKCMNASVSINTVAHDIANRHNSHGYPNANISLLDVHPVQSFPSSITDDKFEYSIPGHDNALSMSNDGSNKYYFPQFTKEKIMYLAEREPGLPNSHVRHQPLLQEEVDHLQQSYSANSAADSFDRSQVEFLDDNAIFNDEAFIRILHDTAEEGDYLQVPDECRITETDSSNLQVNQWIEWLGNDADALTNELGRSQNFGRESSSSRGAKRTRRPASERPRRSRGRPRSWSTPWTPRRSVWRSSRTSGSSTSR